ncbi:MAG: hypothetical protein AAF731_06195 [Bacteroidota bacterium]
METKIAVPLSKKSKWRFIWIIPIGLLIITAIPKLIQMDFMVENMTNAGMGHMILGVGIVEIICVIIFLIPKTRNIGFLLTVAYTGGIIAAEWAASEAVIPGLVIMILLWIGWYFEKPDWFKMNK